MPAVPGVQVRHRHVALRDGTGLHVAEAGDGPALVLLHGWPQHWWAWRHVIAALAQERRVLCPDLRGLGWSDAPPGAYAKETWACDVLALLDALGLERAAIAGHDWGGLVALLAALRAPERVSHVAALSIISPWPAAPPPRLRPAASLAYQALVATPAAGEQVLRRVPGFVRALIRRGSHADRRWTREELDVYAERLRAPERARASSAVYRTFLLREARPLLAGRYASARLRPPLLMLTGAGDPVVGPRALEGLHRHADRVRTGVIAGAGHFPPEERPDAVLRELRAHLRAAEAGRATR